MTKRVFRERNKTAVERSPKVSSATTTEGGRVPSPDWHAIALVYAGPKLAPALEALLDFDALLARILAGANETLLAQMRFAWWREEIDRDRPEGAASPPDPVLAALLTSWQGEEAALVALVDAWEALLDEPPWPDASRETFARANADVFAALARIAKQAGAAEDSARHGELWGRAKLGAPQDAGAVSRIDPLPSLPRALRALTVIGGLSRRALRMGGGPIFGDRLSPLVALRLGIFGT